MARRLNTLLADLKVGSMAGTTTKDQLARLCAAERDQMMDHLEGIAFAARRRGRPHDITDVEMDLENGWAYRLLENFGPHTLLTLDDGCPGRALLDRNGIPDAHIANIKADYASARSQFLHKGHENRLRAIMKEFEIPDSALNQERTAMNIFRGRADALMATDERYPLADKNLSELTGGSPPRETADQSSDQPHQTKASASSADSEAVPFRLTHTAPDLTLLPTPPDEELRNVDFGEVARSTLVDLPISAFTQECENLVKNKKDEWEAATANDARALVRIFTGVLQEHDVAHSGQITQYHIGRLRQHFNDIPTRWGQSSQLRALSTADLRKQGLQMRADAEASGAKSPVGLSAQTIRKHFANLQTFLQHLRGNGFNILDWTFEGVRPKKPKPGSIRTQQYKPTPADIKPIFSAPIFTGCAGWEEREKSGDVVYHDSLFYMPLLFVYLGARRKELAGLGVNDVYETENGWVVDVRANELRRIKTIQSHRLLPLPDELIRLNFLQYRTEIKKLGYDALFPDLFSHLTENDPGDRFYDQFIPVMQQSLGEALWQRSLHALRHGLSNSLKQRGVPPAIIDDLSGRLSDGETNNRYTDVAGISLMRDALAKFPIITDDIQPRDINLLPWVRKKQPPPWARPGRK